MKYSIVVLVYGDRARYTAEALQSLINQTYKDWEALVFFDYATKDTIDTVREMASIDGRINIQNLPEHSEPYGITRMHNISTKSAIFMGDIWCRLGNDDRFARKRLENDVKFMEENPTIDGCWSGYHVVDSDGKTIIRTELCDVKSEDIEPQMRLALLPIAWINTCIKTEFLLKVYSKFGRFCEEDTKNQDDIDAFLKMIECGVKLGRREGIDSYYRIHKGQITQDNRFRDEFEKFKVGL